MDAFDFGLAPRIDETNHLEYIAYIEQMLAAWGPRPFTEADSRRLGNLEEALTQALESLERVRYINAVYGRATMTIEITDMSPELFAIITGTSPDLTSEEQAGMLPGMTEMVPTRIKGATKDRDLTIRRKAEIALGGNPATHMPLLRLADPENRSTCGSCANLFRKDFGSGHVWKCVRAAQTNNDGPDMVKRWPACTLFLPRNGAAAPICGALAENEHGATYECKFPPNHDGDHDWNVKRDAPEQQP